MKTKKKTRFVKAIYVVFDFAEDFVKENPFASNLFLSILTAFRQESENYLFKFGTWTLGKEVKVAVYNCAPTRVIIHNSFDERNSWNKEKTRLSNILIKKDLNGFIRDFAFATVQLIKKIKDTQFFKKAEFRVSFHMSYTGSTGRSCGSESRLVYDSKLEKPEK